MQYYYNNNTCMHACMHVCNIAYKTAILRMNLIDLYILLQFLNQIAS